MCAWATGRRGAPVPGAGGPGMCAWPVAGRVGPFTDSGNPFLRSWALLVAVWAACLDYHLWG